MFRLLTFFYCFV